MTLSHSGFFYLELFLFLVHYFSCLLLHWVHSQNIWAPYHLVDEDSQLAVKQIIEKENNDMDTSTITKKSLQYGQTPSMSHRESTYQTQKFIGKRNTYWSQQTSIYNVAARYHVEKSSHVCGRSRCITYTALYHKSCDLWQ